MSPYTFGNYKASHSLAGILEKLNMKFLTRKLFLAYSKYHVSLKELQNINDKRTYITMHLLLRNYYLNIVDDIDYDYAQFNYGTSAMTVELSKDINAAFRHMNNIIVSDYREALRKRGYSCPRKN
jgi:hypothetical protein